MKRAALVVLAACASDASAPPRRVSHVLATGQSLSVGATGSPPLTTTQPFQNLMFGAGVMPGDDPLTSLAPLVEGDVIPGTTDAVETMSSSFANLVTALSGERLLVSVHGVGGLAYADLAKGTAPYARGMAQASAARDLLGGDVVRAVTVVHGETDHRNGNSHYAEDLAQWQSDYESDVRAITHQAEAIPLFETQIASWTRLADDYRGAATSAIPIAQLAAHVANPGRVVLVGPKYHLPYGADGVHLTNAGYRQMGEDYAKAYRRGAAWEPLRPKSVARAGAVVTVVFFVPSPPLVLDTMRVSDPGSFGFEWYDDGPSTPSIANVAVTAPDTVTITLASPPTSSNGRLRYAFTGTPGALSGPQSGPRGNLRDSDATMSRNGDPLFDWCVVFDEPVTAQ